MTATRFLTIQALTDPGALGRLLGPIDAAESRPLGTVGYSGSTHQRLETRLRSGARRSLVFKHVYLDHDWTAYRTGDTLGREAALLEESRLRSIWEEFRCPYLAYAVDGSEIGLLMDDLADTLLPDADEPLALAEEDRLLAALAAIHGRYWAAELPQLPWLNSAARLVGVLGPSAPEEEAARDSPHPLFTMVAEGWAAAFGALPVLAVELIQRAPELLVQECAQLPHTIIHGDAKVANFALFPDGGVAAFDWAWIGAGPCTIDLGWYLAVNASRLARPKEEVMMRYRELLESALGDPLPQQQWERLARVGILCAARMILWAKALALEGGEEHAAREWEWWVEQLRADWS